MGSKSWILVDKKFFVYAQVSTILKKELSIRKENNSAWKVKVRFFPSADEKSFIAETEFVQKKETFVKKKEKNGATEQTWETR